MNLNKAIAKYIVWYIFILSVLIIASFFIENNILVTLAIFFTLALPLYVILQSKNRKVFISLIAVMLFLCGFIALSFRTLRDILPNPISNETGIGYAQYF